MRSRGGRPIPTWIVHFTHIGHLHSVISGGLVSDSLARDGRLKVEAGEPRIKERRRRRVVPVPPAGAVGDYVPFYFAPRSPMMYSIKCGNVPDFTGDHHDLVYLASTTQKLVEQGLTLVFTDRNAVLDYTDFGPEASSDHLVDWDLMTATWWYNTTEEPDRKERRMAECLVSPAVPFNCILFVATYSTAQEARVREILVQAGQDVEVGVRPDWYF